MKISIVTISFNQAKFLERAMRSVLDQGYENLEYIVVDPGSTDGSRDIIEKYRNRLGAVVYDPDKGPADGLNKGFKHATGDVFGYINSDDQLLPGSLACVAKAFAARPKADVIMGDGYMTDEEGNVLRRVRSTPHSPWWFVHGGVMVLQQSTFFKRQAYLDVDGFNIENKTSWDAELILRMAMQGKNIHAVHENWSAFTMQPASITVSQRYADESKRQHQRYYNMVMGRDKTQRDMLMGKVFGRMRQWILDPMALMYRVQDRFMPPEIKVTGI
ncbi:MAG: glycosyltransferase [Okeania sp. SIO3B3]|nr:glycosyltransferase [Okeania sp. SIO3B3]